MRSIDLKAKAAALGFSCQNDALDYASRCVEEINRWHVASRFDFIERYLCRSRATSSVLMPVA
jgi:hypothetical protein